jgi:DNA-binding XRE family transcriptional regulator
VIEIDAEVAFKLLGQLAPQPQAIDLPQDDSHNGEHAAFCDLPDQDRASLIIAARGLLRWSQERLAAEAGINRRTLQRIETCEGNAQESTLLSVYETLVTAGILLMGGGKGGIGVWLAR